MFTAPPAPLAAALFPLIALVYVAAGVSALTRRPSSRLGLLLLFGGVAWLLSGLINTNVPALVATGQITRTLGIAVIVHLLISFPTGRLHTPVERLVVAGAYFTCLILEVPNWLFAPESPLSLADRPDLVSAGLAGIRIGGSVVIIATAVILIRRMRSMAREQRRVMAPLTVYGIFTLLLVPVSSEIADRVFADGGGLTLPIIQLSLMALVPVAFAVAASRGGFARTAEIAELGAWLGSRDAERPALRRALADTLGDPSLQLLFRLSETDSFVDERGLAVPDPESDGNRGVAEIELAGETVGAIAYDSRLLDRPAEIQEAGRVIALALDRERLTVSLRASRSRLVVAADEERRRIARDLHDGLQSRLVFLAVQAGTGADPATVRTGIEVAIDELRDLVEGVMPVQLTECGLPAAIEDLGDRLPTPVNLCVSGFEERLAPDLETAAWFVTSEAMVNAVKHSGAAALDVSLSRSNGDLSIEVVDGGSGGARIGDGHGLRGIEDRVAALGGRLDVDSSPVGTRVRAVIPCES